MGFVVSEIVGAACSPGEAAGVDMLRNRGGSEGCRSVGANVEMKVKVVKRCSKQNGTSAVCDTSQDPARQEVSE